MKTPMMQELVSYLVSKDLWEGKRAKSTVFGMGQVTFSMLEMHINQVAQALETLSQAVDKSEESCGLDLEDLAEELSETINLNDFDKPLTLMVHWVKHLSPVVLAILSTVLLIASLAVPGFGLAASVVFAVILAGSVLASVFTLRRLRPVAQATKQLIAYHSLKQCDEQIEELQVEKVASVYRNMHSFFKHHPHVSKEGHVLSAIDRSFEVPFQASLAA